MTEIIVFALFVLLVGAITVQIIIDEEKEREAWKLRNKKEIDYD